MKKTFTCIKNTLQKIFICFTIVLVSLSVTKVNESRALTKQDFEDLGTFFKMLMNGEVDSDEWNDTVKETTSDKTEEVLNSALGQFAKDFGASILETLADFAKSILHIIAHVLAALGDLIMSALNNFMLGTNGFGSAMIDNDALSGDSWFAESIAVGGSSSDEDISIVKEGQNTIIYVKNDYIDEDPTLIMGTGSWEVPNMLYCPENIFGNNVAMLDVNFLNPNEYEAIEETEKAQTDAKSIGEQLHETIKSWYLAFRNIAIVSLLSILVYLGIRIILNSTAEGKAKYKEIMKDWVVAVCLIFAMHFLMSAIVMIVNKANTLFQSTNNEVYMAYGTDEGAGHVFKTNFTGAIRFLAQSSNTANAWAYTIIYLTIVGYTIAFTIQYLKRVLYLAFYTMIAPLVAITYPLDKLGDGKSQAFNKWFKEYISTMALQPVHLILYTMFVGSALTLSLNSPIYALVAIGFLIPAEKYIKSLFGINSTADGGLGSFASGAVAMKAIDWVKNGGIGGKNGKGANGKDTKEQPDKVRENKNPELEAFKDENAQAVQNNNNNGGMPNEWGNASSGENGNGYKVVKPESNQQQQQRQNSWGDILGDDNNQPQPIGNAQQQPVDTAQPQPIGDSQQPGWEDLSQDNDTQFNGYDFENPYNPQPKPIDTGDVDNRDDGNIPFNTPMDVSNPDDETGNVPDNATDTAGDNDASDTSNNTPTYEDIPFNIDRGGTSAQVPQNSNSTPDTRTPRQIKKDKKKAIKDAIKPYRRMRAGQWLSDGGKQIITGVAKGFGNGAKFTAKTATKSAVRLAGAALLGGVGLAAGLASGKGLEGVIKGASAGIAAGHVAGGRVTDRALDKAKQKAEQLDNDLQTYRANKVADYKAAGLKQEAYELQKEYDMSLLSENRKKYDDLIKEYNLKTGKKHNTKDLRSKIYDYDQRGITDKKQIFKGLEMEEKYKDELTHDQIVDAVHLNQSYGRDALLEQKNRDKFIRDLQWREGISDKSKKQIRDIVYEINEVPEKYWKDQPWDGGTSNNSKPAKSNGGNQGNGSANPNNSRPINPNGRQQAPSGGNSGRRRGGQPDQQGENSTGEGDNG